MRNSLSEREAHFQVQALTQLAAESVTKMELAKAKEFCWVQERGGEGARVRLHDSTQLAGRLLPSADSEPKTGGRLEGREERRPLYLYHSNPMELELWDFQYSKHDFDIL